MLQYYREREKKRERDYGLGAWHIVKLEAKYMDLIITNRYMFHLQRSCWHEPDAHSLHCGFSFPMVFPELSPPLCISGCQPFTSSFPPGAHVCFGDGGNERERCSMLLCAGHVNDLPCCILETCVCPDSKCSGLDIISAFSVTVASVNSVITLFP